MNVYFSSLLDLEIVACFLALHKLNLIQKNIANPLMDRRSFTHAAQSGSEKALTSVEEDFMNVTPESGVCEPLQSIIPTRANSLLKSFISCSLRTTGDYDIINIDKYEDSDR
jgi:hypothetical protein